MARMRSPNFPTLSLEEAIKVAGELYSKVRKVTVDREAAAKELGYSGLTGRSQKVLGALNQYGFMDNVAKGQCRITDLAEQALHGFPEAEKIGAIHKAAHSPALFDAIFSEFGEKIESEHAIRSFLLKRGFTDRGVESALQSFLESQRFLELTGASESYDNAGPQPSESSSELDEGEGQEKVPEVTQPTVKEQSRSSGIKFLYRDQPLEFSLTSKGLAITGGTNSAKDLRTFIKKLEALAVLLPDD